MVHKQQVGRCLEDIIPGLCDLLVRNFMNNLVKSQKLGKPILFQGGVAANVGMRAAFERMLGLRLTVPGYFELMGGLGAAILARKALGAGGSTRFRGFEVGELDYRLNSFDCEGCSNCCVVMEVALLSHHGRERLVRWGDRCGKWESTDSGNGS
jgi:hypothetical protein